MAPERARIPVAVLTGFLGSGKTTLLNRLLTLPEFRDTAVIVNEFGEIGIDHLLVAHASADPVLVANGCVCCTARGDLVSALDGLQRRRARGESPPFRRVVIETTGLAMPAPILDALRHEDVVSDFTFDGVVATVDALCGAPTLDRYEEARRQAAIADRLILTKTDIAASDADGLAARLRALNPRAPIERAAEMKLGLEVLFGGLGLAHADTHGGGHHAHDGIETFSLVSERPIGWDGFRLWLSVLAGLCGERMLRVKGFVAIAGAPDRPFLVQGVQRVFEPPVQLPAWPSEDHRTRLVFITQGLARDLVAQTLEVWNDF